MSEKPKIAATPPRLERIVHLPKIALDQRYKLIEEAGRGGMGVVFRAKDKVLDREVALKQLLLSAEGSTAAYSRADTIVIGERFLREARVTAQLDHPNIIPVYEISEPEDGDIFYTMKFVRGISLAQRLARIAKTPGLTDEARLQERLKLLDSFVDCCQAVAYAHSKGVLHRDLKPDNIMLGKYGQSLVVDWGLAKVKGEPDSVNSDPKKSATIAQATGKANLTQAGSIVGTPAYLAPEQARGSNEKVSPQSDIFALGAILYEIVSGVSPIQGNSMRETLFKAASADYVAMDTVCPMAPKEIVAIIERSMLKEPAERWASAEDMASEISAWRSGGQVSIYHYSSMELLKRFIKANARSLIAAAAVIVILLGVVGWNMWQASAEFSDALEARQGELAAYETDAGQFNLDALLSDADQSIRRLKDLQGNYDAKTPVKEVSDLVEKSKYIDPAILLSAANFTDERIALAQAPIGDQFVPLVEEAELSRWREDSKKLRQASARVHALLGSWGFAEELVKNTPSSDEERAELMAFVDAQRKLVKTMRAKRIKAVLKDVSEGLGRADRSKNAPLLSQYVFELVAYRDKQTVELLGATLNSFVPKLERERKAFEATKEGRRLVEERYQTWYKDAARRDQDNIPTTLKERQARAARTDIRYPLVLWSQEDRDSASLCIRVLGNLGLGEEAVEALEPISKVLSNHALVLELATALSETRTLGAWHPLHALSLRAGQNTGLGRSISAMVRVLPDPGKIPLSEDYTLLQRVVYRRGWGDLDGAFADVVAYLRKNPRSISGLLLRSDLHSRRDNEVGALIDLDEIIDNIDKDEHLALVNRARIFRAQEEYPKSRIDYERAIALAPNHGSYYLGYARTLWNMNARFAAQEAISTAIRLDPKSKNAYVLRATIRKIQKKNSQALDDLTRAIELDGRDYDSVYQRGALRHSMGLREDALEDLSRAININPKVAAAFGERGRVRFALSDRVGGIEDLTKAIELDAKVSSYSAWRGYYRYLEGDKAGGLQDIEIAMVKDDKSPLPYSLRGGIHRGEGDYDEALDDNNEAIDRNPEHGPSYYYRALTYSALDDPDSALEDLNTAIEYDTEFSQSYFSRALIYSNRGQVDLAIQDYTSAISKGDGSTGAFNNRGILYAQRQRYEEAIADYNKVLEREPENLLTLTNRARARAQTGNMQGAMDDIAAAKAVDSQSPKIYTALASIRVGEEDFDAAIAAYSTAIELEEGKAANTYLARAQTKWAKEDIDGALEDIELALGVDEDYVPAMLYRAKIRTKQKQYDAAIDDCEQALLADEDSAAAYTELGRLKYLKGLLPEQEGEKDYLHREAEQDLNTALRKNPYHAEAYRLRAILRQNRDEIRGARDDYNALIRLSPTGHAYYSRADLWRLQGEYEKAIEDYDKAIELKYDNARVFYFRGVIRKAKDKIDLAIEDATRAIAKDPKMVSALTLRAECYQKQSRFDLALDDCNAALKLDEKYAYALTQRVYAYRSLENWEKAIADAEALARFHPDKGSSHSLLGFVYYNKGDYAKAEEIYNTVLPRFPELVSTLYWRGIARRRLGKLNEAIEDFDTYLLRPEDATRRNYASSAVESMRKSLALEEWLTKKPKTTEERVDRMTALKDFLGRSPDAYLKEFRREMYLVNKALLKKVLPKAKHEDFVEACGYMAQNLSYIRRYEDALEFSRMALKHMSLKWHSSTFGYSMACWCSRAAMKVTGTPRSRLINEAFAALDVAKRNGWRNPEHAKTDKDLKALHADTRWQEFLDAIR